QQTRKGRSGNLHVLRDRAEGVRGPCMSSSAGRCQHPRRHSRTHFIVCFLKHSFSPLPKVSLLTFTFTAFPAFPCAPYARFFRKKRYHMPICPACFEQRQVTALDSQPARRQVNALRPP